MLLLGFVGLPSVVSLITHDNAVFLVIGSG